MADHLRKYLTRLMPTPRKVLEASKPIQHILRNAPSTSIAKPPSLQHTNRLRKPFGMHWPTSQTATICTPLVASLAIKVFPSQTVRSLDPIEGVKRMDFTTAKLQMKLLSNRWNLDPAHAKFSEYVEVVNGLGGYSSALLYGEDIKVSLAEYSVTFN